MKPLSLEVLATGSGISINCKRADHLGDTRLSFDTHTSTPTVDQQDDYFPFGYEISRAIITSPKNEYLYNKKELQEDLKLYDYDARFYDAVIGRWTSVDPLAESYKEWTPYNYVQNDPIRMNDPDGRGHFDFAGNFIADPSDDKNYAYLQSITVRGQTFTWMGSDAGWVPEQTLSGAQLAQMYWAYYYAGKSINQGAYGPYLVEWASSPAGIQSSYRKSARQLKFAEGTSNVAIAVMSSGLTVGEAGNNLLLKLARKSPINLASAERTAHIIEGDANGGGHAWFGSLRSFWNGITGSKSMFPITWGRDKIMEGISEVVVNNKWVQQTGQAGAAFTKSGQPVKYIIEGVYEGIRIRVVATAHEIITAFPVK